VLKIHNQHKAEQDLLQIWLYTFENWGVNQADSYLDKIDNAVKTIANNPQIGVSIDSIRTAYKKYQINEHIIFYTINKSTIHIIRVLGNDMDYIQKLKDNE
jgi:toxin ParE1/3/4